MAEKAPKYTALSLFYKGWLIRVGMPHFLKVYGLREAKVEAYALLEIVGLQNMKFGWNTINYERLISVSQELWFCPSKIEEN